jgi:hypothetical protein
MFDERRRAFFSGARLKFIHFHKKNSPTKNTQFLAAKTNPVPQNKKSSSKTLQVLAGTSATKTFTVRNLTPVDANFNLSLLNGKTEADPSVLKPNPFTIYPTIGTIPPAGSAEFEMK